MQYQEPSADRLQRQPLGRLVAMAGHLASERWTRYLSDSYGLSPAGAAVLMTLGRPRRLTHGDLADACYIRPATLTGVVDTLVRSGHVERKADSSDRRAVWVELTNKGTEVADLVLVRVRGAKPGSGADAPIPPLTSVDADPEKEAVIRAFLIELILRISEKQEGPWEQK